MVWAIRNQAIIPTIWECRHSTQKIHTWGCWKTRSNSTARWWEKAIREGSTFQWLWTQTKISVWISSRPAPWIAISEATGRCWARCTSSRMLVIQSWRKIPHTAASIISSKTSTIRTLLCPITMNPNKFIQLKPIETNQEISWCKGGGRSMSHARVQFKTISMSPIRWRKWMITRRKAARSRIRVMARSQPASAWPTSSSSNSSIMKQKSLQTCKIFRSCSPRWITKR